MKTIKQLIQKVQINIPFTMLYDSYLEAFIENGLNPEIGLDAAALDNFSNADFKGIAKEFHKNSKTVTLHGPFIDLSAGSPDPAVRRVTRQRLEQVMELVPLFKPRSVVCHAGYDTRRYGFFKEAWSEYSLELWSWMADRLAEHGTRLMLENVYEDGPQDIHFLFENLKNQKVGFCLDTGHASAFGSSRLEVWLKTLGPCLGQLHLHDNQGNRDEHLAIGSGKIDFDVLFDFFKRSKNTPPIVTLEPHKEEALRPSLEYLTGTWPW
ncbi:MAG: sugar phosphate isomerase/epimerase [bacterium]|nr:sugar phosphate isomerase/epimerase [bacterium]